MDKEKAKMLIPAWN